MALPGRDGAHLATKWTPNLFLGFAKASYLYNSDISNPLDVLPFEGFLGHRRTQAERTGKKASLGSLFMRYIMPNEQAEMYLEYGRKDISMMPWNVLQNAPYRRAFTGGFRKLFDWKNQSHILLAVELTQLQAPDATLIRNPDSWYTHTYVRQGYTQLGDTRFPAETCSVPSPLSMGLALSRIGNAFVRLPSVRSLREATVWHFETGPLHNILGKGWSEPRSGRETCYG